MRAISNRFRRPEISSRRSTLTSELVVLELREDEHISTHKSAMSDAKLEGVMKKFKTQPIPDIAEVNMFTKDNKIISLRRPQGRSEE